MKRWLIALLIIGFTLTLIGCSNNELSGDKPPKVLIEIGTAEYETILGTYCWNGTCADTAGPLDLLKGSEPIQVKPGEKISFIMDYEPKPNETKVVQIHNNKESTVVVDENQINAPMEKEVYYYSYGVWWMDEKEPNVSHGDAFYAFVIEVN